MLYRIMDQRFASMLAPTLYGGQRRYLKTMKLGRVRDSKGDVASSMVLYNEEGKRVAMTVTRDAKLMDQCGRLVGQPRGDEWQEFTSMQNTNEILGKRCFRSPLICITTASKKLNGGAEELFAGR